MSKETIIEIIIGILLIAAGIMLALSRPAPPPDTLQGNLVWVVPVDAPAYYRFEAGMPGDGWNL